MRPHPSVIKMTIHDLNLQRRAKIREARALARQVTDKTSAKEAARVEKEFDVLMAEADDLEAQIDELRSRAGQELDGRAARGEEASAPGIDTGLIAGDAQHRDAFCDWLRAPQSRSAQNALQEFEPRSANSLTGAAGGYVVPEIIAGPLLSRARDANPLRGVVRVVNVQSGDVVFPLSNADATSGWVGETDPRAPTTEPTLAGKRPTFGVCYSYVKMTEEMAQDAILDVGDWFTREAGAALGEAEMAAIIAGDGTNKPTGLLNVAPEAGADGTRSADAFRYLEAAGSAVIVADEMLDLVYDLKSEYRANGRWLMNSTTAGAVRKLKSSDGMYLWQDTLAAGQPNTFAGHPVTICEKMDNIGPSAHPIAFGDFERAYILAQRSGLTVTTDNNVTEPGYVKLYIRHRIGGCVYDENAVRFLKNAAA